MNKIQPNERFLYKSELLHNFLSNTSILLHYYHIIPIKFKQFVGY